MLHREWRRGRDGRCSQLGVPEVKVVSAVGVKVENGEALAAARMA